MKHPIDSVEWIDVSRLIQNSYNPNFVQAQEFKLLEFSILTNGWIQPILVAPVAGPSMVNEFDDGSRIETADFGGTSYVIIDGFHRATLAKTSDRVRALTDGKVPAVVMDIPENERILLTIRINRAKGTHMAFKMAENIQTLSDKYGMTDQDIMQGIGCNSVELDLLKSESVFKKLDVENTPYSKAWYPMTKGAKND